MTPVELAHQAGATAMLNRIERKVRADLEALATLVLRELSIDRAPADTYIKGEELCTSRVIAELKIAEFDEELGEYPAEAVAYAGELLDELQAFCCVAYVRCSPEEGAEVGGRGLGASEMRNRIAQKVRVRKLRLDNLLEHHWNSIEDHHVAESERDALAWALNEIETAPLGSHDDK